MMIVWISTLLSVIYALPTVTDVEADAKNRLIVTDHDRQVLMFMGIFAAAIFVLWNFPVLKWILHPFKLTCLHEMGHAMAGKCTGAKIESIEIDADTGGVTRLRGGNPYCTLPAGYIGSSFFGGLMVFAGFDLLASKIVSILIGICFLLTLWWAKNWIARVISILYIGMVVGLWFYQDGIILPYIVLFMGVMCSLQSLWDFQGLVLHKIPESDASKFAELCGCCPAQVWAFIWLLVSLIFMGGFALLGVMAFK